MNFWYANFQNNWSFNVTLFERCFELRIWKRWKYRAIELISWPRL